MKNTKIEWCDATWNPVTGCRHGCEYCYARRIAERFGKMMPDHSSYPCDHAGIHMVDSQFAKNPYPFLFEPTFHAYRLGEPARWTKPRTIFVCSMADLFGAWVPDEWISEVMDACKAAPHHRYLFLSKNPTRYGELEQKGILPHDDNYWFGTTVTRAEDKPILCTKERTRIKRTKRREARYYREMRMRRIVNLSYCPHVGWLDYEKGYFKDRGRGNYKRNLKRQSNRAMRRSGIATPHRAYHKKFYELWYQLY